MGLWVWILVWIGTEWEFSYDDWMGWIITLPGTVPSLWKQRNGLEVLHNWERATLRFYDWELAVVHTYIR
jgi:hypothetical protein